MPTRDADIPPDPGAPATGVPDRMGGYLDGPGRDVAMAADSDVLADLTHLSLIRVSGADAGVFLQSQLTNDIQSSPGNAPLAAYCTAQGRMLGLFLVIHNDDTILLQLRRELAPAVVARLKKFVLRAKVQIEQDDSGLARLGLSGPLAPDILAKVGLPVPELPWTTVAVPEAIVVRQPGPYPRFEILAPDPDTDAVHQLRTMAHRTGSRAWVWLDILSGIPELTPETSELFVPQMLNLDALGGISLTKGCYPGQEIIARTHYLGRLKQRMYRARIETFEPPRPGMPLYAPNFPGQVAGHVVEAEMGPDGHYDLLTVLQITSAQGSDVRLGTPEGPCLQFEPLPYPLALPSG